MVAFGAVVVAWGMVWCWRRRELALLAAALGGLLIYAVARPFTLAYNSGKALVVVAPVLTLLALRALLAAHPPAGTASRQPLARVSFAVAVAFVALTAASSALALRAALPRAQEVVDDVSALRPTLQGERTLYLGRDDWIGWNLRGSRLSAFQAVATPLAARLREQGTKSPLNIFDTDVVDVDSLKPQSLDQFRYVVAPRTAYLSTFPENFAPVRRTRWHVLWRRRGATRPREAIDENSAPGALLSCRDRPGRDLVQRGGVAFVRPRPVTGPAGGWRIPGPDAGTDAGGPPSPGEMRPGGSLVQTLELEPGSWEIALAYNSPVPLRLRAPGLNAALPAYHEDRSRSFRGWSHHNLNYPHAGPCRGRRRQPLSDQPQGCNSARLSPHASTTAATSSPWRKHVGATSTGCGRGLGVEFASESPASQSVPLHRLRSHDEGDELASSDRAWDDPRVTAYLGALAVCGVAVAVGAAICCRSRAWSWTAPPVGLAAVMLLALVAVRLPGHGATAAAAVALATIAAVVTLARRGVDLRPLLEGLPVAAAVLVVCSLPFLANDRIGELGAWVLDDLSFHLVEADALRTRGSGAEATPSGYPTGPHSVAAAVAAGLGIGTSAAFTGLLLATPVLTALTALAMLGDARWYLRLPAAALAGIPYLAASYFAEGAFKEPLFALFFLGFVAALRERRVTSLLLTTAGAVAVFGVTALAWPAAALLWLGTLELLHGWRPDLGRWGRWRMLGALAGLLALAVGLVQIVGELDFFETGPGASLTNNEVAGGNFVGQLSPLEALGVWRHPDFRFGTADPLLEPGVLLACGVVIFGLVWCWRAREWALLAGVLGGVSIYAVARPVTLAYFSGKALAVVAPLLTLVAVKALAAVASAAQATERRWLSTIAAGTVLAAYVLVAGASSALALRGARVRPHERGGDLAAFRPIVKGDPTLYLGSDSYATWELRGARLRRVLALRGGIRPAKIGRDAETSAVDFDSVAPSLLARTRYLITPRTAYASSPAPSFRPVARTRWHVLWSRRGPDRPRRIRAEGDAPGKLLNCETAAGRRLSQTAGVAYVRPKPVVGLRDAWRAPDGRRPAGGPGHVQNGDSRTQVLDLPAGTWEISLRYFSDVPLRLRAGPLDTSLPAYLADEAMFASVGRLVTGGGPIEVTVEVPARRRVETLRTVRLGTLAATRLDERGRLIPLARACGRYIDWYRDRREPDGS